MTGQVGAGAADGSGSPPAGRKRINISELAMEEYLQDLERTSTIEAAKGAKRARTGGDISSKAAIRDAMVISSAAIFTSLIIAYGVMPQVWTGHFEWTNTITAILGIGFTVVGLLMIMTSMNEVPSYIMKKLQMVFLVVVVIVALPVMSRFINIINFSNAPLIFINMLLAVAVVGATFNHFMKERMAYFIVWWFGIGIATLGPLYELIFPSSGAGYGGLHKALVASGMIFVLGALMMAATNRKHYKNMENALQHGDDLMVRNRPSEALRAYDAAIKSAHQIAPIILAQDDGDLMAEVETPWLNKGIAYAKMGKMQEALTNFEMAISINGGNDAAWLNKGNALVNMGQFKAAAVCFDQSVKLNPEYEVAWNSRGNAFYNAGQLSEAIRSYDRALDLKKEYDEARYNKGMALGRTSR